MTISNTLAFGHQDRVALNHRFETPELYKEGKCCVGIQGGLGEDRRSKKEAARGVRPCNVNQASERNTRQRTKTTTP